MGNNSFYTNVLHTYHVPGCTLCQGSCLHGAGRITVIEQISMCQKLVHAIEKNKTLSRQIGSTQGCREKLLYPGLTGKVFLMFMRELPIGSEEPTMTVSGGRGFQAEETL